MANLLLDYVPRSEKRQVQVAFPVALQKNDLQPQQFGDGQQNAFASFGPLKSAPFTAVLARSQNLSEPSDLSFVISPEILGGAPMSTLEVSVGGKTTMLSLAEDGSFKTEIALQALKWDRLTGAEPVFFRPAGWKDWFAVSFPQSYLPVSRLLEDMAPQSRILPSGESVVDPLHLKGTPDFAETLRQVDSSRSLDFQLSRVEPSQRVHGVYQFPNGAQVNTGSGGIWSRYRLGAPFKLIYLVKDARATATEAAEGTVSGTGPHYVGATAEVILNTLGDEPLMTFYGIPGVKSGPNGEGIAWGSQLNSQWIGTWLKAGEAFVTPQGNYHWHLNHLEGKSVGAQVWTPPEVPHDQNHFGFPKK
jgi:hypothetical protein